MALYCFACVVHRAFHKQDRSLRPLLGRKQQKQEREKKKTLMRQLLVSQDAVGKYSTTLFCKHNIISVNSSCQQTGLP